MAATWLGTSTDAERAFSSGRLTVSRLRHSLSDESVRASTVLGSWVRIPNLVSEGDMVSLLRRGPRQAQATTTSGTGEGGSSASDAIPVE